MYTDEELSAPYPLPLPALDDIEDTPPFTQATDGLNIEPNQAPLDHPDLDEWGIYRGNDKEPNKSGDDIYYSDNEEESPFKSTYEQDEKVMQKPPIVNDHTNQFDTTTLTILNLQQEVTKLSLSLRQLMRINQHDRCQISSLNSKLQFETMVNTHLKAMLKRTQYRCDDLSRERQHARVFHEHKDEFNKCNESILKYAGYLSTDNFFE
jgi:hypothetical protein